MIYLDNCATTQPHSFMMNLMFEEIAKFGNPSSHHEAGYSAKDAVFQSRNAILEKLGIPTWKLVFTSGGTEANAIVKHTALEDYGTMFCSSVEHGSLYHPSFPLKVLPSGRVDMDFVYDTIKSMHSPFVAIMYANNETGSILFDPADIKTLKGKIPNMVFMSDSVQALGKVDTAGLFSVADIVTISGHKIHGLKGIGAILFNEMQEISPIAATTQHHEYGIRPGTENTIGIKSLDYAVSVLDHDAFGLYTSILRDSFEEKLSSHGKANCPKHRLPNVSSFCFHDIDDNELLLDLMSKRGLFASARSACTSGLPTKSKVLMAMFGEESPVVNSTVRFSFSIKSKEHEVDDAVAVIEESLKEYKCLKK